MKKLILAMAIAAAAMVRAADPVAPFDDYGAATANDPAFPMAVGWQNANNKELAALDDAWADSFFAGGRPAVDALLSEVKAGYATDALVSTKIGFLSQQSMRRVEQPWWRFWASTDSPHRKLWTGRLLAFAEESESVDVKLYFLDQLRWCGYPRQAASIRAIKGAKPVTDFADFVATELEGR